MYLIQFPPHTVNPPSYPCCCGVGAPHPHPTIRPPTKLAPTKSQRPARDAVYGEAGEVDEVEEEEEGEEEEEEGGEAG